MTLLVDDHQEECWVCVHLSELEDEDDEDVV